MKDKTKKTIVLIVAICLLATMIWFMVKVKGDPDITGLKEWSSFMYAVFLICVVIYAIIPIKKARLEFRQNILFIIIISLPNNFIATVCLYCNLDIVINIFYIIGFVSSLFLAWILGRYSIINGITNRENIFDCICVYLNACIYLGSMSYDFIKNDFNYYVLMVSGSLIIVNLVNIYMKTSKPYKANELLKQKKLFKLSTSPEERGRSFCKILSFPITYGTQEFPTSSRNSDCEEKLYDKFGNCNKKEMYTYWIRKHRQCFEQICKNKNIELRDLCEMLFMLYDVITEDGVKKDSDINIRIDRDFNVQIEKLSVSNRELCDAMCSAAEEFLKEEEIEIIPWNELICDNRETEDGIKISAITSRK